jgi:hypothetical protein
MTLSRLRGSRYSASTTRVSSSGEFGGSEGGASSKIEKVPNRGHSLTIDSGWREVAERALAFVKRYV